MKRIIIICLTILWMIIIFMFSNQVSKKSNYQSEHITSKLIVYANKIATNNKLKLTYNDIKTTSHVINPILRKGMHLFVYLVLSILIMMLLSTIFKINIIFKIILCILICFMYAITDEYHQTYISGRSGQKKDIVIDTSGAALGSIIYASYYLAYKKGLQKNNTL